uniref:Transporter n=1 Tax=Hadrurus spadix TaxID=141984 RepID=A0A1W7RAG3_9SCOR
MVGKDSCGPFARHHLKEKTTDDPMDDRSLLPKVETSKGCTNASIALPLPEDTQSTSSEESSRQERRYSRDNWSNQLDFFLSCVGYAVGLGNIWRFPYLCYRSGGGAFLVPYILFLIICGMPLFYLELSFGQFASLGPVAIWKISPLFTGLGYGMVIISGIVCIYYNIIIAWTIYYIYQSFSSVLPWSSCDNIWNTDQCVAQQIEKSENSTSFLNSTNVVNKTIGRMEKITASEEFWLNYVLRLTNGIDEPGDMQWPLVQSLFIAWLLVFLCLIKGVKSSGKVVYVSATFPYIVLVILLIRGLTLNGAWDGIAFYLTPRWELLTHFKVWGDAATQIFYSVGAAWGAILTMASYNRFDNNCIRDSLLIPLINCGTSIFAGFVVFSIIGFMSYETGKPVDKVISEGPGLAFVVYPQAVTRLPLSPLWALLFFFMLFTIGLDSQFGMFETMISAFTDEFRILKRYKMLFTGFMCFLLFILGLPCVTGGGMYVLQLMDYYSATFGLMIISLLETICIAWVYGADRFMHDISLMVNRVPQYWWKLCWCYITPSAILALLTFIIINHSTIKYNEYVYPDWSVALGWMMAILPLIPIPLVAGIKIYKTPGTLKQRIISNLRPLPEWGPAREENRLLYKKSLSIIGSRFHQTHVAGLTHSESQTSCGKVSLNTTDTAVPVSTDPLQNESVV